jgi:hypothetical protein
LKSTNIATFSRLTEERSRTIFLLLFKMNELAYLPKLTDQLLHHLAASCGQNPVNMILADLGAASTFLKLTYRRHDCL